MLTAQMEFQVPYIFAFLVLALVATHASLTPELYWKSVLPDTPMPKAVTDLLQPDFLDEKVTSVSVGKGGVNVDAGKGKPGGTTVNVGKGGVNVNTGKGKSGGGTNVNVGRGGVGVNTGKPGSRTNVGVGKGGVSVNTRHKGKPVYVGVGKGRNPFVYSYAATATQLKEDPNVALFFLEKDMHFGKTMNLNFRDKSSKVTFLPRQVANSIPFSSNKLPEIFDEFSVKPGSLEAQIIRKTIKECEAPEIKGEEKYCATSLESMIDFSTSKLGKQVQAISTEADNQSQMKSYTVQGVKVMTGEKSVVCHKQNYAYAIFYCHATQTTRAYTVSLKSDDGTEVKAVAVCHTDTSAWNPKHLAFQVLKVKPGTVPVCHFLPQNHVVWVPN